MSTRILRTMLALCFMVACGPSKESTFEQDEYASSRHAIESENSSQLLGGGTKPDLRIEHMKDSPCLSG